ncbi:hypothetical protein P0082_04830 [Candidatus Haliotispira prima]|uniref:Lipoprotein n=1 Tax=Candidatus Haliotispira prima TaxID=3034016 RepID=A0ABY8MK05_9SPIO|nr:hypothetical protein P0082_04830 [Candidatus Haliotispira prima]
MSLLSCAPLSDSTPAASEYMLSFPYVGPNELTFSITSELEGEVELTFGISAAITTTLPAQLGKGYIKRTLTKGISREVFMAHLNTIPEDLKTLTAEHFMKENTTYYLNIYRGRELKSQKSFTTAKFTTLSTVERRQGANNIGIHSRDQYFPSNGDMRAAADRSIVSTPRTRTEESSPKKMEVKKEEYLILPMRAVIPILAEPSVIKSAEETEIYVFQVKAFESTSFRTVFTYWRNANSPLITDGDALNSTTVCLETGQTKSVNFDAYLSCMIAIPTSDPAAENAFNSTGNLILEFVHQLNTAEYAGTQKIQNVQLITK